MENKPKIDNKSKLSQSKTPQPLPYAKTNMMKARGKNAAFAWKYQNIKKSKSKPKENENLIKMQEEMQNSINKTY